MQFFLSYFSEGIAFHLEFVWTIWTISSDDSIHDLIHKYLRMKRQRSKTFYVMFIHLDIYSCICECLCFFFIIFAFHWKFCGSTNEMKWNYDHTHIRSFTRSHTNTCTNYLNFYCIRVILASIGCHLHLDWHGDVSSSEKISNENRK